MDKNVVKSIMIKLMIITSIIYIIWRIIFTIPINYGIASLIFGFIFILVELIDFFEYIIHYINVLSINNKKVRYKKDFKFHPDVDVLIATINEDEELLEKTVNACLNLNYSDKNKIHIYICDDGRRNSIKKLAQKYNIGYITRDNNKNAKAGNYNNAIKYTNSKYIAVFDADMCPYPDFLTETIIYFVKGENVGFVQTPQAFYNRDIFQNRFCTKELIPFDQNFFYHGIQSAKSMNNTTVFCGTNAIISRDALNKIGGFALESITEDIATGMLIEEAGYKGIYIDKILARGYSTNDIKSFIKQRKRWAFGCIQMGRKYPICKQKGLNIKQKLEYLSCILYWFFGIKTLLFLIAPVLFSVFNIVIIKSNVNMFLLMWLPQYVFKRFILDIIYENKRSSTWNKIYEIILFPVLLFGTIRELFGIKRMKFVVSEKRSKNITKNLEGVILFVCHMILLVVNIISYTFSFKNGYILPIMFSLINIMYLLIAIVFDLNSKVKVEENLDVKNVNSKYNIKALFNIFKEIRS